jgi:hypothetical protein
MSSDPGKDYLSLAEQIDLFSILAKTENRTATAVSTFLGAIHGRTNGRLSAM